ncbi:MAG: hypothetical protein ACTSWP_09640 [Candidatus Freyarchaeota archaeon]|nr:hypothetical protein [Candidatus Freyrarchaeum guaymaensis]
MQPRLCRQHEGEKWRWRVMRDLVARAPVESQAVGVVEMARFHAC